jgi:rhamnosyltransferase
MRGTGETTPSVCAIIVTYNPSSTMVENIPRVLAQTPRLVVVDNGSAPDIAVLLRKYSDQSLFHFLENRENLGIAEALNRGVRWAKANGYAWVILFDQDSTIGEGFVRQMFATWGSHPHRERIAAIHPKYVDPLTGVEPFVRRAGDGGPVVSMTSGALMPVWIFDKIGEFASEYFIDCVDFEYCLRIRAAGYLIADSRDAVLIHAAGDAYRSIYVAGASFRPTHHSVMRRYYISRNRVALFRKYFRIFPGWVLSLAYDSLRETIKCFIGEADRAKKFRAFLFGTFDGLIGRTGRREGF